MLLKRVMSILHLMAGCLPCSTNWRLKNWFGHVMRISVIKGNFMSFHFICSGQLTAIFSTEFGANLALIETSD